MTIYAKQPIISLLGTNSYSEDTIFYFYFMKDSNQIAWERFK